VSGIMRLSGVWVWVCGGLFVCCFFTIKQNSERCRVSAFGLFIMYIYPGAFVDIGESVHKLPPLAQLRIFCGGVWHNAVLAILCVFGIFLMPCITCCSTCALFVVFFRLPV